MEMILDLDGPTLALAAGTILFLLLTTWVKRVLTVDDGSMDAATEAYLSEGWSPSAKPLYASGSAPPAAEAMVAALEGMPFTEDEGTCAQQMKKILTAAHIPYASLIDSPEELLRVSSGHEGCNGALWTRFTVQYNLFAGSIVALGSDEQRKELVARQSSGALGCFAFTEKGAGVLSGAVS
jgi:alkylation response protein AidB-like acyl-CoA dehydrogenase